VCSTITVSPVLRSSYYYRARYYDNALGRFLNEDPIRFGGGTNFYAYARNNPATWIDPLGQDVTVIQYQGLSANPFGHIGISVNGSSPVGFDDSRGVYDLLAALDVTVPGAVKPITDPKRPIVDTITIKTTPGQDAAILAYIKSRADSPGPYDLLARNCAQFVADSLRAAKLKVPFSILPDGLMDDLHKLFDPREPLPTSSTEIPIGPGVYYNPPLPIN
jgi:hypothetical protein